MGAFVNDFKPHNHSGMPLMTMDELKDLGDRKIEHWDGPIDDALEQRDRRDYNWMLIAVERDERHLVPRIGQGGMQPTPGVLIVAFFRGYAQLHDFKIATPVVSDEEVNSTVRRFEDLLRPTIELAARVQWATEYAQLQQLREYSTRFPEFREVHTTRFSPSPRGGTRVERMADLRTWCSTPLLYPAGLRDLSPSQS